MAAISKTDMVHDLIARLDSAVATDDAHKLCRNVKDVLEEIVKSGHDFIDGPFLQPACSCYARRLLHKDPEGRYSVVVMVWDKGQGTALHDHAGSWCVECVYRGRIRVVSYDLQGSEDAPLLDFKQGREVSAGVGEAGALIPPFEYHTLENAQDTPAVTIHVYGGELTWCNTFVPEEGGYRRVLRELCYTS
jgi:3-mercaptopropionate dioxygenase